MTDSNFKMTDTLYKDVRPHYDGENWATIVTGMCLVHRVEAATFLDAFLAKMEEMKDVEAQDSLSREMKGTTVNKTITKFAQDADALGCNLVVEMDGDKAVLRLMKKRGKRGKSGDGNVSSNSNISAWVAYERGVRDGDTFTIEKTDGGYNFIPLDGDARFIPSRRNGGLVAFIRDNFPSSRTAAILKQYGKM